MRSRKACFRGIVLPFAFKRSQHFFYLFTAIEHAGKKLQPARTLSNRRCATKVEFHSLRAQLIGFLGKFRQQPFSRLRCEPVRDPHQVSLFAFGRCQQFFHPHRWTQKNRAPAAGFCQP